MDYTERAIVNIFVSWTQYDGILKDRKGRFTRYDFVVCVKLTTGLRHELFRVNQTYNSLTTVVGF